MKLHLSGHISYMSLYSELTEEAEAFSRCWVYQEKNQIAARLFFNTYGHCSPFLHRDRWCFASSQDIYWHHYLQLCPVSFFISLFGLFFLADSLLHGYLGLTVLLLINADL